MKNKEHIIVNANQAVAHVAYRTNEVFPIYPITPSSDMSELIEEWSALQHKNIFGNVPSAFEMQSEAGVAGAMHGALQTGSLTSTFTSSQGLLLMMPNMFKIAAELTPNVIHVATRSVATHALSIFGDHSDIMAVRGTGYAFLGSASVQEAMDFALIAQAASLESRIPFVHFFDGFRTSHQISKIELVDDAVIQAMIDSKFVDAHRERALNPNQPVLRGTTQGPDVFFQGREAVNGHYQACPGIVQNCMDRFAQLTGRQYQVFEYVGDPNAEQVLISMASSTETIEETIDYLNAHGEKIGLLKVRLFRPFGVELLLESLPRTCKTITVLDRTKEPGSMGEPLYLDVSNTVMQSDRFQQTPKVLGGRYGLGSKEFTPAMVKAVVVNMKQVKPKNNFTVGISDDVTQSSLMVEPFNLPLVHEQVLFYETKASKTQDQFTQFTKFISQYLDVQVQGYMEIDYKKSDSRHVSHLRYSMENIKAPYLIANADVVLCEDSKFVNNDDILDRIKTGGTLIILSEVTPEVFWSSLSNSVKTGMQKKNIKLYVMDSKHFSTHKEVSPLHAAYLGLLQQEFTSDALRMVDVSKTIEEKDTLENMPLTLLEGQLSGKGNELPVSVFPVDGTYETGTSEYNRRNIAEALPVWDTDLCTQCGACSMACPSGALRIKAFESEGLVIPDSFDFVPFQEEGFDLMSYTIQVNPDQCTGCQNCVDACPAKALVMEKSEERTHETRDNWAFMETLPEIDRNRLDVFKISQQQLQEPLFKYPMGEDGCGEAPYLKLVSQLFGDRMMVANATGASSIFGGALSTTPWSKNQEGRGPAWSNSLFEDNAEFGLGYRLSLDQQTEQAKTLLKQLLPNLSKGLASAILNASQVTELEINQQRDRVEQLKAELLLFNDPNAAQLMNIADSLVKKSVWIIGGDGWAYDIGYGGLDHVLASGKNVNILVLDNEVYANTGGQMSKATPFGASAKFAYKGKTKHKKDLGLLAMNYEDVYVASVAIGANQQQTLQAFLEAETHDGPSIIIAYCHSASHGIDTQFPSQYHKAAVVSGQWLLYRNDPHRILEGLPSLQLDSDMPSIPVTDYLLMEGRFKNMFDRELEPNSIWMDRAQKQVERRFAKYQAMANEIPSTLEKTFGMI
ncbi:4Fe-4S binding protein [Flagellimonas pelagia]|uniref:4Fe-4S dicluster domain-containing protein n=1 Tax=Flagellimonas pelagia TaxID=2306998 RepID=A0A3A1NDT7_9FLAO|nr:4Fe-4S binding protein [Allomuricauda maritima]RIV42202.1 4Fe-4S dicluster domain-containing protein [Allomuricauda maritima]TXJ91092.1 4Fe-4S dicluster domain-containing protein [Allomuricauda maritima]